MGFKPRRSLKKPTKGGSRPELPPIQNFPEDSPMGIAYQIENENETNFELVETLIMDIVKRSKSGGSSRHFFYDDDSYGTILCFLSGWDEISTLRDQLRSHRLFGDTSQFIIIPLHSSIPSHEQRRVFDRPPSGVRKIVLATNIAETSITIDDVVFVIDAGKVKEKNYNHTANLTNFFPTWISKASCKQRGGRAGRTKPGYCFHLYSKMKYQQMVDYQIPEILRMPLQELVLQIKVMKFPGRASDFLGKAIQPPSRGNIHEAVELLRKLGAVDSDESLTILGNYLAKMPTDPKIGKMILFGLLFRCLDSALTIAGCIGYRDPYVLPMNKKADADEVHRTFEEKGHSDHLAYLRAFDSWIEIKEKADWMKARSYCDQMFLSESNLRTLSAMKNQFFDLLREMGLTGGMNEVGSAAVQKRSEELVFGEQEEEEEDEVRHATPSTNSTTSTTTTTTTTTATTTASSQQDSGYQRWMMGDAHHNTRKNNVSLMRSILFVGLYPNISQHVYKREFRTKNDRVTLMHPSSINYEFHKKLKMEGSEIQFPGVWGPAVMIFQEKLKTNKIYLRNTTLVSPLSVLFFVNKNDIKFKLDESLITIEDWFVIKCVNRSLAQLLYEFYIFFDSLLLIRIEQPHMTKITNLFDQVVDLLIKSQIL
eukprot:TRINITY_DN388_c1_g1_i1.p2 TRINITY_DN388_c1_g1~~TRINITY_DN388_c1_g1_i1.p2  ORF type:complete len:652 (+),score=191.73 TRINITY_DN388_c1_g1_i1:2196-4151(+)